MNNLQIPAWGIWAMLAGFAAFIGLLVVYCIKDVQLMQGSHGIPEFIGIAAVALLHLYKSNMMLSIAGGTALYMILVNLVF